MSKSADFLRIMWEKNIEYIVQKSDVVISHVNHGLDNAFKCIVYANRLNKRIISLI